MMFIMSNELIRQMLKLNNENVSTNAKNAFAKWHVTVRM